VRRQPHFAQTSPSSSFFDLHLRQSHEARRAVRRADMPSRPLLLSSELKKLIGVDGGAVGAEGATTARCKGQFAILEGEPFFAAIALSTARRTARCCELTQ